MKKKRSGKGRRLGQHFLTGQWAARKLAEAAAVQPDEVILEIGPGKGALTKELLALAGQETGARVVAIEKDEDLVRQLGQTFEREIVSGALTVITEDVRNVDPERLGFKQYVVAANIPYYITGEIIRQFLETQNQPRALAILVQKEVADRIVARNGKESVLSLSVKAYGTPRIIARVSRGNFSPSPSVDSAILLIDNISRNFFADINEKDFFDVVRLGFSSKRKFLANNLSVFGKENMQEAFVACNLPPNVRAEDIPLDMWLKLGLLLHSPEPK